MPVKLHDRRKPGLIDETRQNIAWLFVVLFIGAIFWSLLYWAVTL